MRGYSSRRLERSSASAPMNDDSLRLTANGFEQCDEFEPLHVDSFEAHNSLTVLQPNATAAIGRLSSLSRKNCVAFSVSDDSEHIIGFVKTRKLSCASALKRMSMAFKSATFERLKGNAKAIDPQTEQFDQNRILQDERAESMCQAYCRNPELAAAMVAANPNVIPIPAPTTAPPSVQAAATLTTDPSSGKKKKRKSDKPLAPLPAYLKDFTYPKDKERVKLAEELDKSNEENPGPYEVAKHVTVEGMRDVDLDGLLSHQLRELAISFGCKGCGSASKFKVRLAIASRIRMGTQYENNHIPDVGGTAADKRNNSLVRIINAVFHSDNVERFLKLNDTLSRGDFESVPAATNPINAFRFPQRGQRGTSPCRLHYGDVANAVHEAALGQDYGGNICQVLNADVSKDDPAKREIQFDIYAY